jgi:hypothetical protein
MRFSYLKTNHLPQMKLVLELPLMRQLLTSAASHSRARFASSADFNINAF